MRVYSEQEVSQILERAAERQARTPSRPDVGLTLDDLERIAADTGLDVAHLRAAAAEVDAAGGVVERRSRSASHLFVERWGVGPLTDEAWDDLVSELQNRFGKSGMGSLLPIHAAAGRTEATGRNREWVHIDGLGIETRVMASGRGDRTRLRLSQRVGLGNEVTDGIVVGLGLGAMAGLLAAGLGGLSGVWFVAVVALTVLAVGLGTYAFDVRWRRRKHDDLDALADHLIDTLAAPTAAALPAAAATDASRVAVAPPLSLDALGPAPEAPSVPSAPVAAPSARDRA